MRCITPGPYAARQVMGAIASGFSIQICTAKKKEKQKKAELELGEQRTENIIEIQMIEHLIKNSEYEDDRKISKGKCL